MIDLKKTQEEVINNKNQSSARRRALIIFCLLDRVYNLHSPCNIGTALSNAL